MASAAATDARGRLRVERRRAVEFFLAQGDKLLVGGLVALFIAISVWWVRTDSRVPNGDNAKHTLHAFRYFDQFELGHWLFAILHWTSYPPLVHVVGAAGVAVWGASNDAVVLAENVIFVPLLALGCYQAGRIAFGRLAGVLTVVFVLGAPMIISLFHVFMVDAPAAAMAALTVWFLLASRRFASLPWSLAAAVAFAAGMHVKATFVMFVAGFALALLVRGGWRRWRHVLLAAGAFLILVEPWYFAHLADLRGLTAGAISPQTVRWYDAVSYPSRWTLENFGWYWWTLVNAQLYLPLTIFFVVGSTVSMVAWFRHRRRPTYVPELLFGALFAYFGISLISLDDPRYLIPGIVYAGLLGTGWIVSLPWSAKVFAIGALGTVFLINTTLVNYVSGDEYAKITLPGARGSPIGERSFTLYSNRGYVEGRPHAGGATPLIIDMLRRAREDGARRVVFQPESMNNGGYNLDALAIMALQAGLEVPGFDWRALASDDIYVFRIDRTQAGRPACLDSWDSTGLYMVKGPPSPGKPYYCPPPDPE